MPKVLKMRLNQFLAHAGLCSRRKAEPLILSGAIHVNGKPMTDLAYRVSPSDSITYQGKLLRSQKKVYILLNKPSHTVTTLRDPEGRRTVMDLLAGLSGLRIYPVGRLDYKTTGLLLLTNDGPWAQALAHPSKEVPKVYALSLDKPLTSADAKKLLKGFFLSDGLAALDGLVAVGSTHQRWHARLHSGKNRIVRRIFAALGYKVQQLDRITYGKLSTKGLKTGQWRFLTPVEARGLVKSTSFSKEAMSGVK